MSIIKIYFLIVALSQLGALQQSQAQLCKQLFVKSVANPILDMTKNKSDFSFENVMYLESYRQNGCGVICVTNLIQGLRLQEGLLVQDPYQQLQNIVSVVNPGFQPNSFGSHGTAGTLEPQHVGSLKRIIENLIEKNKLERPYTVSAFQKAEHAPYFAGEKDILFLNVLPKEAFVVNDRESKIILVEVNDKNRPYPQGFLTAHFYTVVDFKNGIVTLHDPRARGKLFRFEVVPYTSGEFRTMELRPLDSSYKLDQAFPSNLHYMVNGYVSVMGH